MRAEDGPPQDARERLWRIARDARMWPEVIDAVCGDGNLTLFASPDGDFADLDARLRAAWSAPSGANAAAGRTVEIPVWYGGDDGPDLAGVAERAGLSQQAAIASHAQAEYTVLFLGFLPGFAYLGGLDPRLATPRRDVPRASVPAGSVAIGGDRTAVYPVRSPGGWHVIGRTDCTLFDVRREPASLLLPGDRVRFVPAR